MTIQQRLNDALASTLADEERRRPAQERFDAWRHSTPPVILREPPSRGFLGDSKPRYTEVRLGDIVFVAAHVAEYHSFGDSTTRKRHEPDRFVVHKSGTGRSFAPDQIGDYLRRPTAKAQRRIDAAHEAIRAARRELAAAVQAAFTYGKPVPASTAKATARARKAMYEATVAKA